MSLASPPREEHKVPWLQNLFENIWFLLIIGVFAPTIVYTGWSLVDLLILPRFGEEARHAVHGAPATATPTAAEVAGPEVIVSMKTMAYEPNVLEIEAGTTVTWVNDAPLMHAVAYGTPDTPSSDVLFAFSGDFAPGESFSYTFTEPGTHEIYCSTIGHYAAGMTMTIHVKEEGQ